MTMKIKDVFKYGIFFTYLSPFPTCRRLFRNAQAPRTAPGKQGNQNGRCSLTFYSDLTCDLEELGAGAGHKN